jgi:hypothetical protein
MDKQPLGGNEGSSWVQRLDDWADHSDDWLIRNAPAWFEFGGWLTLLGAFLLVARVSGDRGALVVFWASLFLMYGNLMARFSRMLDRHQARIKAIRFRRLRLLLGLVVTAVFYWLMYWLYTFVEQLQKLAM